VRHADEDLCQLIISPDGEAKYYEGSQTENVKTVKKIDTPLCAGTAPWIANCADCAEK
jgi:hypothetical protein